METGECSSSLAAEPGVKRTMLYRWRDTLLRDGEKAFPGKPGRRSNVERLTREHGADGATELAQARRKIADGTNTYLYDAEGRVCAVHGVFGMTGYQYDADGTRIAKGTITTMSCDVTQNGFQPTSDFVLDLGNAQMTEVAIAPAPHPPGSTPTSPPTAL